MSKKILEIEAYELRSQSSNWSIAFASRSAAKKFKTSSEGLWDGPYENSVKFLMTEKEAEYFKNKGHIWID